MQSHRIHAILERQRELRDAAQRLTGDVNEAHWLVHQVLVRAMSRREGERVKALVDDLEAMVMHDERQLTLH